VVVDDDPDPPLARMIAVRGVPLITGSARAKEILMSARLGPVAVRLAGPDAGRPVTG
jgi:hypothetical protein